eukprot:9475954-Pyramimonas_sp.AAC.1
MACGSLRKRLHTAGPLGAVLRRDVGLQMRALQTLVQDDALDLDDAQVDDPHGSSISDSDPPCSHSPPSPERPRSSMKSDSSG